MDHRCSVVSSYGIHCLYWLTNQNRALTVTASEIDIEYERRCKAMSPAEKVSRSAAMFAWTCQQMARRLHYAAPSLSDEEVK